ncbi:nicolin-1 isoform X4 [Gallus gallus]|uniref:nicolin-1 isoform X4 n=1 Tax=Gallus gallus TaxID=9031 RepID=UPI001F02ADF3|nr:nicolin-1 isoform X4 [Gallus gallus]
MGNADSSLLGSASWGGVPPALPRSVPAPHRTAPHRRAPSAAAAPPAPRRRVAAPPALWRPLPAAPPRVPRPAQRGAAMSGAPGPGRAPLPCTARPAAPLQLPGGAEAARPGVAVIDVRFPRGSAADMLCDMEQVTALRFILRQPSPAWLHFGIEELQLFPPGSKTPPQDVPSWLSQLSPPEQPPSLHGCTAGVCSSAAGPSDPSRSRLERSIPRRGPESRYPTPGQLPAPSRPRWCQESFQSPEATARCWERFAVFGR